MTVDVKNLEKYPEIMSKEQFYKACHISKRMAEFVLNSGLVPCTRTGKKTHSYLIRKSAVEAFIKDRAENPGKYVISPAYDKRPRTNETIRLSFANVKRSKVREYYAKLMKNDPEILDVAYVAGFTGYTKSAVLRWIGRGQLKCYCRIGGKYLFSKDNILDCITSDSYNDIGVKSYSHVRHLKRIMGK